MLECNNIEIAAGNKLLFKLDHLMLEKGLYALVGRNGCGKSTFLNALLGEYRQLKGEITLDQVEIRTIELNALAKKISIVRTKSELFGDYKTSDILMLGRLPYQNMLSIPSTEDYEIVNSVVEMLGLQDLIHKEYNLLSDGEKQLIMVGRAFVQDTDVVLLDEPAAFLDLVNRQELLQHLRKLSSDKNKLIIFSTHQVESLTQYCDGLLLINNQELKFYEESANFNHVINSAFNIIST